MHYTFQEDRRVRMIRRLREKIATSIPQPILRLFHPLNRLLRFL
jgi:hypothetical protein